ncbi:MAG: hypothetical protein HPY71_13155 [Firmicutes bacterium]|nr:hypothetical protein [Bacillota bacterium]
MNSGQAKHFYYRFADTFYPYDVYANNGREARQKIRKVWGLKRLPRSIEIWQSNYVGIWDAEFEWPGHVRR